MKQKLPYQTFDLWLPIPFPISNCVKNPKTCKSFAQFPLQQQRGGGSFSKGVLCLEERELVTAWALRTARKVTSDGATFWPL